MDSSRVLRPQLQLLLHLGEIPSRQLVVNLITHLTVDMSNLFVQVAPHILLLLNIFLNQIGQDVVQH